MSTEHTRTAGPTSGPRFVLQRIGRLLGYGLLGLVGLLLVLLASGAISAGDEMDAFAESADQLRASGKLGALPVVVLTAGGRAGEQAGQTAEQAEHRRIWRQELQPELARLSSRGKQIVVANTDHMIPLEQPEAVTAALRDLIEELRKGSD